MSDDRIYTQADLEAAVSAARAEAEAWRAMRDAIQETVGWKAVPMLAADIYSLATSAPSDRADLRALRERVENLAALTEGPLREGTSTWRECDRDAYSLAIEEAQTALLAPSPAEGAGEHSACARTVEYGLIRYACGIDVSVGTPNAYEVHVAMAAKMRAPAPVVTPSAEDGA